MTFHASPHARSVPAASEDGRLACRVGRGDEAAFERIVERYRSRLLGYVRPIVGSAGAEDAVQQTLIKAWRSLDGGCEVRDLRGWLFAIAHREALQGRRAAGAMCAPIPEWLAGGCSPSEHAEQKVQTRVMLSAIADLPEPERDALVWTSVQGHSGRDVAIAMGVSEGAVRQLVHRARTRVRDASFAGVPLFSVSRIVRWCQQQLSGARTLNPSIAGRVSSLRALGLIDKMTAAAVATILVAAPAAVVDLARHDRMVDVLAAVGTERPLGASGTGRVAADPRPVEGRSERLAPRAPEAQPPSSQPLLESPNAVSGEPGVAGVPVVPAVGAVPAGPGSSVSSRLTGPSGRKGVVPAGTGKALRAPRLVGRLRPGSSGLVPSTAEALRSGLAPALPAVTAEPSPVRVG